MVYKLSEHNQILIALFAIVVLCAGKLFKDYLFRGGYIEGMTVDMETTKRLMRPAQTTSQQKPTVNLKLKVTLGSNLPHTNGTLTLSWTGSVADNVTISTNANHYTASTVGPSPIIFTKGNITTTNNISSLVFTASSDIAASTKIEINVSDITIYQNANSDTALGDHTLTFTVTSSNQSETPKSIVRELKIFAYNSNLATAAPFSPITEIKNALDAIQQRLDDSSATGPNEADREEYIKTRNALTKLMASTYGTIQAAGQVFDSRALYDAQTTAIDFIKKEKKRAADNAKALKTDNSNKRRMAQVNTYYTKNYEANTDVMKNIIIVSVALIILAVLRKKNLIPESIGTLGVIFILTLGGIVVGTQAFDIMRRNDHDFDKYDWNFNEDELNKKKLLEQNSGSANLSDMGLGMAACYGPGCCADGTSWSSEMGQCLPNVGTVKDGTAVFSGNTLTITFKAPGGLSKDGTADTVYITLPSHYDRITRTGLFQRADSGTAPTIMTGGTPAGDSFSGTIELTNTFPLTKTSTTIAASSASPNTVTIKITGLAVNPAKARDISKFLTLKTSKDLNLVRIKITGV
jgi:hypothetical protein